MTEATVIFSVAKGIFTLFQNATQMHTRRKQEVATYLSDLATTIEDATAIMRRGEYPQGKCTELKIHSEKMVTAISDVIGQTQAEQFAAKLEEVHSIEGFFVSKINNKPKEEQERNLTVLDQAAGMFRASAALVRVSS